MKVTHVKIGTLRDCRAYEPDRFDWAGALWLFCSRYHGGQWSRGYRILSRLAGSHYRFKPGLSLDRGQFESEAQREIYCTLVRRFASKV